MLNTDYNCEPFNCCGFSSFVIMRIPKGRHDVFRTVDLILLICIVHLKTLTAAFVPVANIGKQNSLSIFHSLSQQSKPLLQRDRWRLPLSDNPEQVEGPSATVVESKENEQKSNLPFFLDPNTKGGVLVLTVVLFIVPIIFYNYVTENFDVEEVDAGRWIGVGFTLIATLLWTSTYIFRVANKGMTYAKQLKDYEDAVIARRLGELDEDEVQALMEEIERDEF